ncbi:MAG: hypothetical protein LBR36_01665, partial [Bacteroidales bacterium]|nr:hypothetical protein [Bacteroidales bacterium]
MKWLIFSGKKFLPGKNYQENSEKVSSSKLNLITQIRERNRLQKQFGLIGAVVVVDAPELLVAGYV